MRQGVYAFRYKEAIPYLLLDTIGWQSTQSPDYSNDGHSRTDSGHVIFQFTLSGEGRIELDGQTHRLLSGTGFVVTIPSEHRYYYDNTSGQPWEFIWLNAKGEDAVRMWERIIALHGSILSLQESSPVLDRFWELYRGVSEEQLSEPTELSVMLYRFMLALLMPDARSSARVDTASLSNKAKQYMKEQASRPLTLRQVAAHCGVTSEYLCRLFRRNEGISPLQYLRRRRIETAVTLLRTTTLEVHEIGRQCGFDSPSYFAKTFKAYLGLSPSEFRSNKQAYPFDTIFLD